MNLYIMRHGEAEPFKAVDADRSLTSVGETEVSAMANWLKKHHQAFDWVLVSPYKRTRQTAQLIQAQGINFLHQEVSEDVTPSGEADITWLYIQAMAEQHQFNNILVVSHMPFVSYLVEASTMGQDAPIFATAAIAKIEYDDEVHKLISLTCPESL